MNFAKDLGFCGPAGLVVGGKPSLGSAVVGRRGVSNICRRPSFRRVTIQAQPQCQMPGNIEDLPLEKVPQNGAPMPVYWSRPGVYGVYAGDGSLQYVAAVENVCEAIEGHVKVIKDAYFVNAVRMITADNVEDAPFADMAQNWVNALANSKMAVPPGNTDEAPLWRQEASSPNVSFSRAIVAGNDEARVKSEIKSILRTHRVVLFMKGTRGAPRCGFSRSVVELLEKQIGDEFVCVDCLDSSKNPGLREGIKQFSSWPTIPQLFVNGDFVGGADIVYGMVESGEIAAVLHS